MTSAEDQGRRTLRGGSSGAGRQGQARSPTLAAPFPFSCDADDAANAAGPPASKVRRAPYDAGAIASLIASFAELLI